MEQVLPLGKCQVTPRGSGFSWGGGRGGGQDEVGGWWAPALKRGGRLAAAILEGLALNPMTRKPGRPRARQPRRPGRPQTGGLPSFPAARASMEPLAKGRLQRVNNARKRLDGRLFREESFWGAGAGSLLSSQPGRINSTLVDIARQVPEKRSVPLLGQSQRWIGKSHMWGRQTAAASPQRILGVDKRRHRHRPSEL